jgi:hypothetical protein
VLLRPFLLPHQALQFFWPAQKQLDARLLLRRFVLLDQVKQLAIGRDIVARSVQTAGFEACLKQSGGRARYKTRGRLDGHGH